MRAIEQAGGICTYCHRKGTAAADPDGKFWVRDHIVPRCRGGRAKDNLALACTRCNSRKGSKSVEDFLAYMKAERNGQNT
jgi:5-methylcytosine-specific restriction endonuclease McrA